MASTAMSLALAGLLSLTSMVFSGLFVYTSMVLVKYTPVYSPVSCISFDSVMGEMQFGEDSINMTGASVKSCHNPNNYPMTLAQASEDFAGQVWVKMSSGELLPIGNSTIADVTFEAGGTDNLTAELFLELPFMQAIELLDEDKVALIAEFKVFASAEMTYLGQTLKVGQEQTQVCGFEVRLGADQVGVAACAGSIEELVIPDVNATIAGAQLMEMTPEQYEAESRKKNLSFGMGLALYFLIAVTCGACGARVFLRAFAVATCKDAMACSSARAPTFSNKAAAESNEAAAATEAGTESQV